MLLCCVSVWSWREKGFDLHTHVLLRVQYSCGGVLVIWFWWEIDFVVTHIISVQYSCAIVSVLLRPEKKDTVVCLAGVGLLLQPEKKDTVVCLAGA